MYLCIISSTIFYEKKTNKTKQKKKPQKTKNSSQSKNTDSLIFGCLKVCDSEYLV